MEQTRKPICSVLPGDQTEDFQSLVDLYKAVTGRVPTKEELEEAQTTFDAPDNE